MGEDGRKNYVKALTRERTSDDMMIMVWRTGSGGDHEAIGVVMFVQSGSWSEVRVLGDYGAIGEVTG